MQQEDASRAFNRIGIQLSELAAYVLSLNNHGVVVGKELKEAEQTVEVQKTEIEGLHSANAAMKKELAEMKDNLAKAEAAQKTLAEMAKEAEMRERAARSEVESKEKQLEDRESMIKEKEQLLSEQGSSVASKIIEVLPYFDAGIPPPELLKWARMISRLVFNISLFPLARMNSCRSRMMMKSTVLLLGPLLLL